MKFKNVPETILITAVFVFVISLYFHYSQVSSNNASQVSSNNANQAASTTIIKYHHEKLLAKKDGSVYIAGYGAESFPNIPERFGGTLMPKGDSHFIALAVVIKNDGMSRINIRLSQFKLFGPDYKEYSASSHTSHLRHHVGLFGSRLNPGITELYTILFRVPKTLHKNETSLFFTKNKRTVFFRKI